MLIWSFAGLLVAPLGLYLWSEVSGIGQDLGFIQVQIQFAFVGFLLGAAAGVALAGSSTNFRAKAQRVGIVTNVVLLVSFALFFAFISL